MFSEVVEKFFILVDLHCGTLFLNTRVDSRLTEYEECGMLGLKNCWVISDVAEWSVVAFCHFFFQGCSTYASYLHELFKGFPYCRLAIAQRHEDLLMCHR